MLFPILAGQPSFYKIARSLRFNDDDTAYMNRTPGGAGDRRKWTVSFWFKRCNLGLTTYAAGATLGNSTYYFVIGFDTSDRLVVFEGGSATRLNLVSTQSFRDPTAWMHIVFSTDTDQATAGDRNTVWINGTEVTSWSTKTDWTLNWNTTINNNVAHSIGVGLNATGTPMSYFDGYIAEYRFIGGSKLTASDFGRTDPVTGTWMPKKYSGTYGTNGFYLDFADNGGTANLGYDAAGSNDWTTNNFSVTAGVGNDSLTDTPTNYADGGNGRGNYAVLSAANKHASAVLQNGGLDCYGSAAYQSIGATLPCTYKTYAEATIQTSGQALTFGIYDPTLFNLSTTGPESTTNGYAILGNGASLESTRTNNVDTNTTRGNDTAGDVFQIAFDPATGKLWLGRNNTWQGGGDPAAGTTPTYTVSTAKEWVIYASGGTSSTSKLQCNFGQRPFAYTPPTGFKALNTFNLSTPTIKNSQAGRGTILRTGTGAVADVTGGLLFQPDIVLIKSRGTATTNWNLFDSSRGVQKGLTINAANAEYTDAATLTAFNSLGFSLGADGSTREVNVNTHTYANWLWKKGAVQGLDIVIYSGDNSANRNIDHNLGVAPTFVIVIRRDIGALAWIYHSGLTGTAYFVRFDANSESNSNSPWGTANWSATQFMVTNNATNNANATGGTYVAYLFADVPGFSKFGYYTANGAADGPFIHTGFRPGMIMLRQRVSGGSQNWTLFDSERDPENVTDALLTPNSNAAEATLTAMDMLANGFKVRTTDARLNSSGVYFYAAWARYPFKYANAR